MNAEGRKTFIEYLKRIRNMTLRDREQHDFSIGSDEARAGITCFSATACAAAEAYESLEEYVRLKKYRVRAVQWLGLLTVVNNPGLTHGFIFGREPWAYDERLEVSSPLAPGDGGRGALI